MSPNNRNALYHTDSAPHGKQNNYEVAYNEAATKLASSLIGEIADKSGATIISMGLKQGLVLPFLGDEVVVTHPGISVSFRRGNDDVPMWAKILILHYLVRSGGAPVRDEKVTFKQLEGGLGYYPAFQRRSIAPLLDLFGTEGEQFMKAGASAGGAPADAGDHALTFRAFPRVEATFVLWEGDNELPPSGSVIFDISISDYLSTEDVAVLCNMIAVKILKASRSRS
jgi:hypothetical protein